MTNEQSKSNSAPRHQSRFSRSQGRDLQANQNPLAEPADRSGRHPRGRRADDSLQNLTTTNFMPTNNFGDNWLTNEERRFWGTDEYGNPVSCVPTDEEVEREVRNIEFCNKIKLHLWFWWAFFGWPWLFVLWAILNR
jgi:hypothetical protein